MVEEKLHAKETLSYKVAHRLFKMDDYCKGSGVTFLKNEDAKVVT